MKLRQYFVVVCLIAAPCSAHLDARVRQESLWTGFSPTAEPLRNNEGLRLQKLDCFRSEKSLRIGTFSEEAAEELAERLGRENAQYDRDESRRSFSGRRQDQNIRADARLGEERNKIQSEAPRRERENSRVTEARSVNLQREDTRSDMREVYERKHDKEFSRRYELRDDGERTRIDNNMQRHGKMTVQNDAERIPQDYREEVSERFDRQNNARRVRTITSTERLERRAHRASVRNVDGEITQERLEARRDEERSRDLRRERIERVDTRLSANRDDTPRENLDRLRTHQAELRVRSDPRIDYLEQENDSRRTRSDDERREREPQLDLLRDGYERTYRISDHSFDRADSRGQESLMKDAIRREDREHRDLRGEREEIVKTASIQANSVRTVRDDYGDRESSLATERLRRDNRREHRERIENNNDLNDLTRLREDVRENRLVRHRDQSTRIPNDHRRFSIRVVEGEMTRSASHSEKGNDRNEDLRRSRMNVREENQERVVVEERIGNGVKPADRRATAERVLNEGRRSREERLGTRTEDARLGSTERRDTRTETRTLTRHIERRADHEGLERQNDHMELSRIREIESNNRDNVERQERRTDLGRTHKSRREVAADIAIDDMEIVGKDLRRVEKSDRINVRSDILRVRYDDHRFRQQRSDRRENEENARRVDDSIMDNRADSRDRSRELLRTTSEVSALRGFSDRHNTFLRERLEREDIRQSELGATRRENSREHMRRLENGNNRVDDLNRVEETRYRERRDRSDKQERMDVATINLRTEPFAPTTIRTDVDSMGRAGTKANIAFDIIEPAAMRDVSKTYTQDDLTVQNEIQASFAIISKTLEQSLVDTLLGAAVMAVAYRLKPIQFTSKHIFGEIY